MSRARMPPVRRAESRALRGAPLETAHPFSKQQTFCEGPFKSGSEITLVLHEIIAADDRTGLVQKISEMFWVDHRERFQCRNLTKDLVRRDEMVHQFLIPQLKRYGQLQPVKVAKTEVERITLDEHLCHGKL